jgi:membrane protease YdiL (CAAX protease family)
MFLQILVFYILTWFFLLLLGGLQEATGILPPEIGLAQWAPGIAALLTVVVFRKDGIKITFISKTTPALRYLWAVLIPAGVGVLVYLIRTLLPIQSAPPPDVFNQLLLVLIWTPFGALGEEIGWRGYLNKKLDTRMRGLFSAILVGVLWTPIHFFAFIDQGPVVIVFLTLWFISLSIVIYGLVQDTGFSVLVATVFHLSINYINLLFLDVYFNPTFWMLYGSVWAIVAAIFVLRKREIYIGTKHG